MTRRLILATPELNDDQRQAYFGARSDDECNQLAEMFEAATPDQRTTVYRVMDGYAVEFMAGLN